MLSTGVLLLFLLPGLGVYCAIYGIFHSGKSIAPDPPPANSLETVAIIAAAAIAIHALTGLCFIANAAICGSGCPVKVPPPWLDPYHSAIEALDGKGMSGRALTVSLLGVLGQAAAAYGIVRVWLNRQARRDRLPAWIYGWATDLANNLDNSDGAVTAYVLTKTDVAGHALAYAGLLNDLAMKADGSITRITLVACERHLVDLASPLEAPSLSPPLSSFSFMALEASEIRNVAFELLYLPPEDE